MGNLCSFDKVLDVLGLRLRAKNLPPGDTLGERIRNSEGEVG